jgi:hypothetical protein
MDLRSLSGHDAEDRSLWIRLQRHMYRQLLDEADASPHPPETEPPGNAPQAALPVPPGVARSAAELSPKRRAQERLILDQADALLHLFQEQGRLTLMRPAGPHGRQFLSTCQRLENLFDGQDSFNALGWLWKNIAQERADDLHKLLAFGDLLRQTLGVWRAVLVE